MEDRIRTELWIMVVLQLGGPLDPTAPTRGKGKGKEVEKTDESKLAMVQALLELMGSPKPAEQPAEDGDSDDDDPLGERIDWTADEPSPHPPSPSSSTKMPPPAGTMSAPPIPILFHTLTTLLSLAATPTSLLQLQLSALSALEILIRLYLSTHPPSPSTTPSPPPSGPSPLLATALPGTASTLSRVALSLPSSSAATTTDPQRRQPASVVAAALGLLAELLVAAVGDEVTAGLRKQVRSAHEKGEATLEELVESFTSADANPNPEVGPAPSDVLLPASSNGGSKAPPLTGPTLPTPSWLAYTLTSITSLLASLSPLSTHDSPLVRAALVGLLGKMLQRAGDTLGEGKSVVVEGLLVLAGDEWEQVGGEATEVLHEPGDASVHQIIVTIIRTKLVALPGCIRRQDDLAVTRSARVVRVALDLLASASSSPATTNGFFSSLGLEKWSWTLLSACDFERIPGAGRGEEKSMSIAWLTGGASLDGGVGGESEWPTLRLRNVADGQGRRELESLWEAVGRSAGVSGGEGEVVDLFLGIARSRRGESSGASALWVLDGVLRGLNGEEGAPMGKKRKKVLKGVVKSVLEMLEGLEEEEARGTTSSAPAQDSTTPSTDALAAMDDPTTAIPVEHQRGVTHTAGLDALKPVASSDTKASSLASHRILLLCISLRLLSTTASLLGSSFQPHLLQVLYHVLAHLSPSTHPLLRAHAQYALHQIAYSTSYASAQNLVLANVDYVVNSVSQRLSVARLDPAAPLVLVEMIRLVGQPIVPMVQDLVEDVMEALDDYHGYEEVTVGLWAVLDALMKVMAEEELGGEGEGERRGEREESKMGQPDSQRDWAAFEQWFATRHDPAPVDEDGIPDEEDSQPKENPRQPFKSSAPPEEQGEGDGGGSTEFPTSTDTEVAPTRPQAVAASILNKALYFLSHSSPFLRSRVLSLITSAVPLLAPRPPSATSTSNDSPSTPSPNRQSDILPVIHRAWPLLLLRLADPEPYVVLATCELLESLATHVGTFLSRRILDDVWPRFRLLLSKQAELDRGSALAGKTKYSTSHRAYRAILRTMTKVVRDVPIKEDVTWEVVLLFRRFLHVPVHDELADEAERLYLELGRVSPDAVWLALGGAGEQEGVMGWLEVNGLQQERLERLLEGI